MIVCILHKFLDIKKKKTFMYQKKSQNLWGFEGVLPYIIKNINNRSNVSTYLKRSFKNK